MASAREPDFSQQVSVKMSVDLKLRLQKFHERHKISPNDLLRALAEAAVSYSEKHGYFTFPLVIVPAHNVSKALNPEYIAAHDDEIDTGTGKAASAGDSPRVKSKGRLSRTKPARGEAA